LFTPTSLALIPWIVPSILVGVPIGGFVIKRVRVETFRRICMSFDAYVVAFGLSRLLGELRLVDTAAAYLVLVVVAAIDTWLLYRFFSRPGSEGAARDPPARSIPQRQVIDEGIFLAFADGGAPAHHLFHLARPSRAR
jgi:hypothetical protein